jgi:Transposase IS66 family
VHVGCWAHARRKFVDAVKVNPQDGEAVKMVTRMDALFLGACPRNSAGCT